MRSAATVLLALLSLCAVSRAGESGSPTLDEEFLKQERIYRGRGVLTAEGYVTDRSLLGYALTLSPEFDRELAGLGPDDRWLDVGTGEGEAILDYHSSRYDLIHAKGREQRGEKAQAVGISIEDRRSHHWEQVAASLAPDKIRYLFARRLREYSTDELGQFQVISDVFGGFSYARDLSLFVVKAIGFLRLNGGFYTVLQDTRLEDGSNRPYYAGSPFLTAITNADGSEGSVCSWLKSIACVEVACEAKKDWRPVIETYSIRKVCSDVRVPGLELTHYQAGTPPERGYRRLRE